MYKRQGFIGANGAGKTTTIRSILHLISHEAGTIKFKGKDISKTEKSFKDSIGVVFDEGFFYDELTLTQMKNLIASSYSHWDNGAYTHYLDAFSLRPDQTISSLSWHENKVLIGIGFVSPCRAADYGRCLLYTSASISQPQQSVDLAERHVTELEVHGRHDPCIVPRAAPVAESAAAVATLELLLQNGALRP